VGDIQLSKALPEHVDELLADLRPLDRQEVEAASGEVRPALFRALELSDDPVAMRLTDGSLVSLFGLAPITTLSDTGSIWLLGTTKMKTHPREVIDISRRYIAFVRERYPRLMNYVDARNRPSVRWLRSIGFTVEPPTPFGLAGLLFHKFHMGFDNV
jgi:RimJ/RimL family protein N-acetyltransferase